jgi:alanyl-tRNA synthetase
MTSEEIRGRFLKFFEKRGHKIIPSASLVPENDPSSLFITAGMQPLVPYLLGQEHPLGKRLVDAQKCVRTGDIEDVGDNRHLTFFEMLGNWSLGDYFKKEAIRWSFEFITSKEEGLGLDPSRLYITVFKGENGIPRDEESINEWREVLNENNLSNGVAGDDEMVADNIRIIPLGTKDNFWIAGSTGPCGGDTEMFYDTRPELGKPVGRFSDLVDSYRFVEIWYDVFIEFNKTEQGAFEPLTQKNVDTGMGLERTTAAVNGKDTVFDTDLFVNLINETSKLSNDTKSQRIIADHFRTAVFMISDGVAPSNTGRGYVLRRLLRRALLKVDSKNIDNPQITAFVKSVVSKYSGLYDLESKVIDIIKTIDTELIKFEETLKQGLKEFEKTIIEYAYIASNTSEVPIIRNGMTYAPNQTGYKEAITLPGTVIFDLYQTYGFPIEIIAEIAKERGINVDTPGFEEKLKQHQELSRTSSVGMFKGGLANTSEQTIKLHTAHHLLLAALQEVLGKEVKQKGSNITEERLRMDFSFPRKLTSDELRIVENIVNRRIEEDLTVLRKEMPRIEAETIGAEMEFGAKYPDIVSLYFIEDKDGNIISKEFCGGPHVEKTSDLSSLSETDGKLKGNFKIIKEEAVSAGTRRIKATLG